MGQGLRFRNVDLHVHTPASGCFIEPDVTPEDIVRQALAVGMDAIAITDHNSAEMVDAIKEAASSTELTIFPGVEITVQPGVHVTALFPTDRTSDHINDLLAELGIGVDDRGSSKAMVTRYGVQEVISIVKSHSALPILAHIDDVKGAWHELQGQTRLQLWQEAPYAAVEIVGSSLPDAVGRPPYTREPAYFWASDNPHPEQPIKHSHKGIGARYSCFKLDEPITWEGLRQCFEDPDVRIYRGQRTGVVHPILERIQVFGGFWDGIDVELNPDLNCVIGGRGTGKSALLEILRYAFDIPARSEENRRQAQNLLENVFPTGAHVVVCFMVGNARYRVERVSGRMPKIFRFNENSGDNAQKWSELSVAPADLLPVQVYGQKEIYQISLDPKFQLRLLDDYVADALKPIVVEENRLISRLRTNGNRIMHLRELIEASQEQLAHLEAIQEEIRRMEELEFVERVKKKDLYEREKRLLEEAESLVEELLSALDDFSSSHQLDTDLLSDEVIESLLNCNTLRSQREIFIRINSLLKGEVAKLREKVARAWATGEVKRDAWQKAYTNQEKAYQDIVRELAEEGELGPDRYIQLQQRLAELESLMRKVDEFEDEIRELEDNREQLLLDIRDVRNQQYHIRCQKADELTKALNKVRLTLYPEGNRKVYKEYLNELFRGLYVRKGESDSLAEVKASKPEREPQNSVEIDGKTHYLIPEIPRYLDPIALAKAIREEQQRADEDQSLLKTQFGVESDAMRRNMSGVSQRQLLELELFSVPDLPIIELQVEKGLLGYRELDRLSIGQKCTVLLSIVLLEGSTPLLIDQPEDDLDNQFIFNQIVETLRQEREERQFLIATHNANIPVSGNADLIMVFEAESGHGRIAEGGIGSLDVETVKKYVADILEGGSEAFCIRRKKYGKMIEQSGG